MMHLENSLHCNLICVLYVHNMLLISLMVLVDTWMYVLCCVRFHDVNFQHVRELSERWMCPVIIVPVFYIIVYSLFPIGSNIVCIIYSRCKSWVYSLCTLTIHNRHSVNTV